MNRQMSEVEMKKHEALIDEEIRQYLRDHADDEYSDEAQPYVIQLRD